MSEEIKKSILIIDDEIEILSLLRDILEPKGFTIKTVQKSGEALGLANKEKYAIVLADLKMPRAKGFQLIKELIQLQPQAKLIVMSGYGNQMRSELEKMGIKNYLVKPINFEQLYQMIQS